MSFLIERINKISDQILQQELEERVAIVEHKIKFMAKIPVVCLNTKNQAQHFLNQIIDNAGGTIVNEIEAAKTIIYFEPEMELPNLLALVANLLNLAWPAVTYNHVYLLANTNTTTVLNEIIILEDIAEILHPGSFIFGNEGQNWVNFVS